MDIEDILRKFQRALIFRQISQVLLFLGALAAFILRDVQSIVPSIILFITIVLAVLLNIIFWRCPACGKLLPLREFTGKIVHCQSCGTRLRP